MTGFREELFGPVATITEARDADHALALANDSNLAFQQRFTASETQARRFADELECGGLSTATAPAMPAWRSAA